MFGMEDPVAGSADLTIVTVEHKSLAKVLKTAFNAIWDTGMSFDEARRAVAALEPKTA
jgi:hypothetical protein